MCLRRRRFVREVLGVPGVKQLVQAADENAFSMRDIPAVGLAAALCARLLMAVKCRRWNRQIVTFNRRNVRRSQCMCV